MNMFSILLLSFFFFTLIKFMFPSLFAKVAQELTNTVTGKKMKKTKLKEECINKKQSQGIRKNIHIDYWFKM